MRLRFFRRSRSALILLASTGCATVSSPPAGVSLATPLPPGTYALTAQASYRNDDDQARHMAYATFAARLYVNPDGTTELYDGNQKCTDIVDLPDRRNTGRRRRPRGHYFSCGGQSWSLWTREGKVEGRMSAPVTEMVQSRMKCLEWSYGSGRQVCERYGVEVSPRASAVSSTVTVRRVGQDGP